MNGGVYLIDPKAARPNRGTGQWNQILAASN
jgi:hypothetical protein